MQILQPNTQIPRYPDSTKITEETMAEWRTGEPVALEI